MNYRSAGRNHAKAALEMFFENKDLYLSRWGICHVSILENEDRCKENIKEKMFDLLEEVIDNKKKSGFVSPVDPDDEFKYNDSAFKLIDKTIDTFVDNFFSESCSVITDPEKAYRTGFNLMKGIVLDAGNLLTALDFNSNIENILKEKSWFLLEERLKEESIAPVLEAVKIYYDKGIHDALEETAALPAKQAKSLMLQKHISRSMRYEKEQLFYQ